jgi:hypothetical protein
MLSLLLLAPSAAPRFLCCSSLPLLLLAPSAAPRSLYCSSLPLLLLAPSTAPRSLCCPSLAGRFRWSLWLSRFPYMLHLASIAASTLLVPASLCLSRCGIHRSYLLCFAPIARAASVLLLPTPYCCYSLHCLYSAPALVFTHHISYSPDDWKKQKARVKQRVLTLGRLLRSTLWDFYYIR